MKLNELEHNLLSVVDEIEKDISLGNFQTTKTEDFFLRVLSAIYELPNLENLAYDKINTEAIDLIDRSKNLGIQITAQKFNEKLKIDNTIQGTIKHWKKEGIKTLWIFFISETGYLKRNIDTTTIYDSIDCLDIYVKTVKRVIGDANKQSFEKRIQLNELIKQETSSEYTGLHNLNVFHQVVKGQNFVKDNFFNHQDTIYLSEKELKTIYAVSRDFDNGKLKEYCILGNPCSGKTTFGYSIIQKISRRKIFYVDLANPDVQYNLLNNDLNQISHNYSLIVVDNLHENISLYKRIKEKVESLNWVSVLFLSRYYKTFDEFDSENIYRLIEGIPFYRIDKNESFDSKVSGIIWKKIKQLKQSHEGHTWKKGNFNQVIQNTNKNLLKLNIALRLWEKKNKPETPITLDKIDSNKILQQFYEEHGLEDLKSNALYTYCLLFKNDIPFILMRNFTKENRTLREKGIILQYHNSDFSYFPHREYARLIYDSFVYIDGELSNQIKSNLILQYLLKFDGEENSSNTSLLISRIFYSDDNEIVPTLLNSSQIIKDLEDELKSKETNSFQVDILLKIIFKLYERLNRDSAVILLKSITQFYKLKKLSLYVYQDFMTYTRLVQLNNLLINVPLSSETYIVLGKNEKANTNSIVELTHRIGRKKSPETVNRILHSFDFSEWLDMVSSLPKFSNITNSLSELNKSTETRTLLHGLVKNIDWDKQLIKLNDLKIDQLCKSVRELQKVDHSIGTAIAQKVFDSAIQSGYFENKLNSAGLSEYCKSVSDLSKLNSQFITKRISNDFKSGLIRRIFVDEESVSNFTARAIEIRKLFNNTSLFFEVIRDITLTESFKNKIEEETNLNSLLIYSEFQNKYLDYKNEEAKTLTKKVLVRVIKSTPNKLEILANPKILNLSDVSIQLVQSVTSSELEDFFKKNKFTYAEDLFRVLSDVDKDFAITLFSEVDNDTIVNGLMHKELNFSQALEDLNKLKNKVYKDESSNCNSKISVILNKYLKRHISSELSYKKLSISDFIQGYYYGILIDPSIIKEHSENDLINKLSSTTHDGFEISPLFQSIRRLSQESSDYSQKIEIFLEKNILTFVEAIKNEDIVKSLSALSELRQVAIYSNYASDLLFRSKKWIIKKMYQKKNEKIYNAKLVPDLQKIAIGKSESILVELKIKPITRAKKT